MFVPILIGIAAGTGCFFVLSRFVKMVTSGEFNIRMALFGFAQFLIPLAVLTICALVRRDAVLGVGIGLASSMICLGVIKLFAAKARSKGRDSKDDN